MANENDSSLGFGMRPRSHRVERFCDACGQVDDHPHAIHCMPDGVIRDRHIDCCAAAGCPEGTCDQVEAANLKAAKGSQRMKGATLVKALEGGLADDLNYSAKGN